ncbi:Predicted Zn-dependent peptidase [Paenibacillus sp. yr247]|uniref:EF-P 5-aminopentanol modification-associated protein YfmF n=1 Tax=Paenibacillus sp. yr247 TaxID=1761880 RepID=UPI00087E2D0F|nr:pitrilysin family protein [Paenibacillus sp. yr247]SDM99882.1 Predicted Zn-dependent peptidase [Paenibacillus sp. yr247]
MKHIQFERSTWNHIRLHVLPTDRFKTFAISVYIGRPLEEETVTNTALTPFVLRRGTELRPETQQFREYLDDLYGAGFGFDIYKRGDYQIVQFRMDIINDRFVKSAQSLLKQGLEFVGETLTRPALEDGHFRDKYVDAEKETLQKRIESVINDKIRYAAERCIEEMCSDDPYRLHPLGKIDDLDHIKPGQLYEQYKLWLQTAPIDIYVVGNTTLSEVEAIVKQAFSIERNENVGYVTSAPRGTSGDVNTIVERLDVNQGKLNMGLRTNISYRDEKYPVALMYNGVLGGYPHSKLFINVREKASLAYYASSRFDGHKGILTIQSGIEMANYEKAVAIIRKQLTAMEQGEINDIELSQTRAMIANQLREIQDSAFELISFDFNTILSGKERTVSSLIESVEQVDIPAIAEAAKRVQLDTIYFLRDQKGE